MVCFAKNFVNKVFSILVSKTIRFCFPGRYPDATYILVSDRPNGVFIERLVTLGTNGGFRVKSLASVISGSRFFLLGIFWHGSLSLDNVYNVSFSHSLHFFWELAYAVPCFLISLELALGFCAYGSWDRPSLYLFAYTHVSALD